MADGKLPSRRDHETDPDKTALQTIMSEVDDLSRDRDPAGGAILDDDDLR
jgi:RNA polymerase sigma-70 factor (ECF subfamily)